ncbi:hypothetical protein [Nonomuraea basaltis]|uniref:hypothetical protein n=1 Tax=Nonomuraea basaltis TaxID=2495887 RepID=UPI00110C69B4|nr:hypothetical protein [Nonomuraea basaltis]TMR88886.1 hypothetical protein EJK15_63760 [Nonomuraea basaltis]
MPGEAARESIGGAVGTAATLPAEQGGQLLRAAQAAFIEGVHLTSFVTAAVLGLVALLALAGLRGVPKEIPEEVLAARA